MEVEADQVVDLEAVEPVLLVQAEEVEAQEDGVSVRMVVVQEEVALVADQEALVDLEAAELVDLEEVV